MLDFSGNDEYARLVAIHYANQFNDQASLDIIENRHSIKNKQDVLLFSQFFWKMVDASIKDRDNKLEVLGEIGLKYWMEQLLNIINGHLERIGFEAEWDRISDKA